MTKEQLAKLLAEIDDFISQNTCGCWGLWINEEGALRAIEQDSGSHTTKELIKILKKHISVK